MSALQFTKATKKQAKLRLALEGPAGFGKTYTALVLATEIADGKRIAFIDTEAKSASKYAHLFDFDVIELEPPFHPNRAIEAIHAAVGADYGVAVIDSLSHFWAGSGGLLEIVDEISRTKYRGDSHRAWADAGKIQQDLTDAILRSDIHVIAAMRTKKDYVREVDDKGKTKIRAAGTKTVQRDEFDYEFDVVGRFDQATVLAITKSRVDTLPPETIIAKPGAPMAKLLKDWLGSGEEVKLPPKPTAAEKKKLADAIGRLAELKPDVDWNQKADASAVQKFGVGIVLLSKVQTVELTEAMAKYAVELEAAQSAETNGAAQAALVEA